MKLCPLWIANSCSASQEIHRVLWHPNVHDDRVYAGDHWSLSWADESIHILPLSFLNIHCIILILSALRSSKWLLSLRLSYKHSVLLSLHSHTCLPISSSFISSCSLCVTLRRHQYLYYITSNGKIIDEWWSLRDVEGNDRDVIEVPSQQVPSATE
jgi:hypothetical protein